MLAAHGPRISVESMASSESARLIQLLRIVERASDGVLEDDAVLDACFG
jgi:hypothetical protein